MVGLDVLFVVLQAAPVWVCLGMGMVALIALAYALKH